MGSTQKKQLGKIDDITRTYELTRQRVESYEQAINEFKKEAAEMEKTFSKSIEGLKSLVGEQRGKISSLEDRANKRIRNIYILMPVISVLVFILMALFMIFGFDKVKQFF